jgi:PAS domain S-box-containing protein
MNIIPIDHLALNDVIESLDDLVDVGFFRIKNGNVIYGSSVLVTMFGCSSVDELCSLTLGQLCADATAPNYLQEKVKSKGYLTRYRLLCKQKNGTNFWVSITGRKIKGENGCVFDGTVRDISEQVEAEQVLKQRELQFEKLTMELDRFIYSASHEIRSPISTMSGVINLMRHDLKGVQAQEYIGYLEQSIEKLEQIVLQLTGHVKNYRNPVEDRYIDFEAMLKEIVEGFQRSHPAFGKVSLSVEIDGSSVFHSDPNRLQIILHNIIKNSLDYMDDRKSVKVISVSVYKKFEKATIEVFDNGVGIPTTHLEKVFDMFYRATTQAKGSGIGLYTVREAVTKIGGTIKLFSEFGVGTSVIIELPNSKKGKLVNKKKLLRSTTAQKSPQ